MKYKNYYKILELKSDRVSDEEIKNAYRRLAKKYHPDINPGDIVASEKFKDVNEAYQILGDENSKRKYDRIHNFYRMKDTIEDTKEKFNSDGFSEMFDIVFGKKKNDKKYSQNSITGEDIEAQIDITIQEAFYGVEKKLALKIAEGKIKNITLKIPKGIKNGEKIRIASQGKQGKNNGKNGDLYIKINIIKDENYRLQGSNIISVLKLTPWEAALGCDIKFNNIDSALLVRVPKGIQSGERLRIANGGFWQDNNERGDLLLDVKIMIPDQLDDAELKLFKELSRVSKFEPRKNITKEKE